MNLEMIFDTRGFNAAQRAKKLQTQVNRFGWAVCLFDTNYSFSCFRLLHVTIVAGLVKYVVARYMAVKRAVLAILRF